MVCVEKNEVEEWINSNIIYFLPQWFESDKDYFMTGLLFICYDIQIFVNALEYIAVSNVTFVYKKNTCSEKNIDVNICLMDVHKILYNIN